VDEEKYIVIGQDEFIEEWNEYLGYHNSDEWFLDPM
jgi:hypothetical protein